MKGIYKRELKSYFYSMIGYVFIAFLVAFVGIYSGNGLKPGIQGA